MNELPILFKKEMVLAILDGRKTQTRRATHLERVNADPDRYEFERFQILDGFFQAVFIDKKHSTISSKCRYRVKCPYGNPYGKLWVKENHRFELHGPGNLDVIYSADNRSAPVDKGQHLIPTRSIGKNLPSIFMRRTVARIILQKIDIRMERIQDITENDAWAEGCEKGEPTDNGGFFPADQPHPKGGMLGWDCARDWFADLFNSINGPEFWNKNGWVWVIEFKQVGGKQDGV